TPRPSRRREARWGKPGEPATTSHSAHEVSGPSGPPHGSPPGAGPAARAGRSRDELETEVGRMQRSRPTMIVMGMMGRYPFAGVAWQVLHYLEGFRRLGCEGYYIEDTGEWPYDPEQNAITADCRYTTDYISRYMSRCGLSERWAYRAAALGGRTIGLIESHVASLLGRADALVNLTGSTVLREEHMDVPVRIYLETDPVMPQIEVANGRAFTIGLIGAHTHMFTFGENLGSPD